MTTDVQPPSTLCVNLTLFALRNEKRPETKGENPGSEPRLDAMA